MNIKKIIKEEVDEFDWIRNLPTFNPGSNYIISLIDEPLEHKKQILDLLSNHGYNNMNPEPILMSGDIVDYELDDGFNLNDVCYFVLSDYIWDDGSIDIGYYPCHNRGYTYEWVKANKGKDTQMLTSRELIKLLNI